MANKTLYIIDALSQIFKAYYAIPNMSHNGRPTNATFGFCQIFQRLLKTQKPEHLVVAFDTPGPSFRNAIYSLYKANRPPVPEDLPPQIKDITRVLDAMRIPMVSVENFEADDVIATIARRAEAAGMDVSIISSDKDLMQLINDKITMLRMEPKSNDAVIIDAKAVEDKWGVRPDQIADLLALMGDTTDNVPGVAGIGPKTAATLLETYGTLDETIEAIPTMKGRIKDKLQDGIENARFSRRLVGLEDQVPIVISQDFYQIPEADTNALRKIYMELGFRRLVEELDLEKPRSQATGILVGGRIANYRIIRQMDELLAFRDEVRDAGILSLDTETDTQFDKPNPIFDRLVGISMSYKPYHAVYVPIAGMPEEKEEEDVQRDLFESIDEKLVDPVLTVDQVMPVIDELLSERSILKVGHNIKYDLHVLMRYLELENEFYDMEGCIVDTMLAAYLLNPDRKLGLKSLVADELDVTMTQFKDVMGKNYSRFSEIPIEDAYPYACADADYTLQLWKKLEPKLCENKRLWRLFSDMEIPLIGVLMRMERGGTRVRISYLEGLKEEYAVKIDEIKSQIMQIAGTHFNPASPIQTAEVLFDKLKLPRIRSNSTDERVLTALRDRTHHPILEQLLELRRMEKLNNTYVSPLLDFAKADPFKKKHVHTVFRQAAVATGRLASSDPNLQNIPVRSQEGLRIREGFIPDDISRHRLMSADYSQIELRILAHLSQDPELIAAFKHDDDIHTLTAAGIFKVPTSKVTKEMRSKAKVVNFSVIYGKTFVTLASDLKISNDEARDFIAKYFDLYAGVKYWLERTIAEAEKTGFVETLSGRRRYIPDLTSSNGRLRETARRVAVNAPIQGTAADMMKQAMINVDKWIWTEDLSSRMLLQVHDELILDVPTIEIEFVKEKVIDLMTTAMPLSVPILVDVATGKTWAECS